MFRRFGTKQVRVIPKGDGPARIEPISLEGHVQSSKAFFAVDAPVYMGDVLEIPDPRGGDARYEVSAVKVHDYGPLDMRHIEAHITPLAQKR